MTQAITSLNQLKNHFKQENTRNYFFISPSNFNAMGMESWINNFNHIVYADSYDRSNEAVYCPEKIINYAFNSIEEINEYLLHNRHAHEFINSVKKNPDLFPGLLFLFYTPEIAKKAAKNGYSILLPDLELRNDIDNKITTTEIGNSAQVPSAPNVLTPVRGWQHLCRAAEENQLGDSWVIQTPFGDSGKTTFFIKSKEDYDAVRPYIEVEDRVKVMKKINCRGLAVEACITDSGIAMGPILTELIGLKELTPYPGGWCGNECDFNLIHHEIRREIYPKLLRLGQELKKRGYMGNYEVDFLIDTDTQEVYLGEINPRLTGITTLTNQANIRYQDIPFLLFHLAQYSENPLDIDFDAYNETWLNPELDNQPVFGQMIIKSTNYDARLVEQHPQSGYWKMNESGQIQFESTAPFNMQNLTENTAYFLRLSSQRDLICGGTDIGVLFLNHKLTDSRGTLNTTAQNWNQAIQAQYITRKLTSTELNQYYKDRQVASIK